MTNAPPSFIDQFKYAAKTEGRRFWIVLFVSAVSAAIVTVLLMRMP